jgi:hypothetical protein
MPDRRLTARTRLPAAALAGALALAAPVLAQNGGTLYDFGPAGTVTDTHTGLMWMRCSLGQTWDGEGCLGDARELTLEAAQASGSGMRFAGFEDWRLPSVDELRSLIRCSNGWEGEDREARCRRGSQMPAIDVSAFPATPAGYYWTATPFRGDPRHPWIVLFRDGGAYDAYDRDFDHHVRLVRGGR